MTHTYTPQPGSLASQVIGFFQNNPDEELGLDDIADKFDAVRGNIHTILRMALDAGLVQRTRNVDGDYIYTPGAAITKPSKGVDIDALHASRGKPAKAPKPGAPTGFSSVRLAVDFDNLTVEEGVMLPDKVVTSSNKWKPLFDKLTKPGQSIAMPRHLRGAISAAALKRTRLKVHGVYRVVVTAGDQCRVFRIE